MLSDGVLIWKVRPGYNEGLNSLREKCRLLAAIVITDFQATKVYKLLKLNNLLLTYLTSNNETWK